MKHTAGKSSGGDGGGVMGFLLVFFPEESQNQSEIIKKPNNFSLFPSFSTFKLTQRAQSTISICLLLVLTTLLLFTISTLPPAGTTSAYSRRLYGGASRRHLRESTPPVAASLTHGFSPALQGMGILYGRGTRAMNDVVVAHAPESLSLNELKLFLRLFFRSGLAAKTDLVLLFPTRNVQLDNLILRERDSFAELLTRYESGGDFTVSESGFDPTHFTKAGKERGRGEPIWGQKNRSNHSDRRDSGSKSPSYGSVVGFTVDELDPENSLSGFLEHVPVSLRRWACYPMLLGRVRRNFEHTILVDLKDVLLLGDPLGRVRSQTPESVFLTRLAQSTQSNTNNSVESSFVMGGSRGVRRLSNSMLTNIVRISIENKKKKKKNKKKNPVTESSIFNQLVGNEYLLKDVNLIVSTESLPELSSLAMTGTKPGSGSSWGLVKRGNRDLDVINSMVMKHICSFPIDSTVYSDC